MRDESCREQVQTQTADCTIADHQHPGCTAMTALMVCRISSQDKQWRLGAAGLARGLLKAIPVQAPCHQQRGPCLPPAGARSVVHSPVRPDCGSNGRPAAAGVGRAQVTVSKHLRKPSTPGPDGPQLTRLARLRGMVRLAAEAGLWTGISALTRSGSPEIRTQDQSVKSRVLYR